jgi:hypothetical protein
VPHAHPWLVAEAQTVWDWHLISGSAKDRSGWRLVPVTRWCSQVTDRWPEDWVA